MIFCAAAISPRSQTPKSVSAFSCGGTAPQKCPNITHQIEMVDSDTFHIAREKSHPRKIPFQNNFVRRTTHGNPGG